MENSVVWIKKVLEKLNERFYHKEAKANITLPLSEDKVSILVFSFFHKSEWYGFGVTEEDFKLEPDELIDQIKKDLKI
jgi:hypothetical protein